MPTTQEYMHVLVLTALPEEMLVLTEEFRSKPSTWEAEPTIDIQGSLVSRFRRCDANGGGTRVGLSVLGGPGNIWALSQAVPVIRELSPRVVLLLGLAGGNPDLIKRGDVCYGSHIDYSSYGKLEERTYGKAIRERLIEREKWTTPQVDERFAELKAQGIDLEAFSEDVPELRLAEGISADPNLVNAARELHRLKAWPPLAAELWRKHKTAYDDLHFADHKDQSPPENAPPHARDVTIASGEWVVASAEYKKLVEKLVQPERPKQRQRGALLCMFEMESYGIGLYCSKLRIPFLVIKGISDYGGDDKRGENTQEKDRYRLAALCSASAFAMKLLDEASFLHIANGDPPPGWSQTVCLWGRHKRASGKQPQQCSLVAVPVKEFAVRERQCMRTDVFPESQEVLSSRVFEDIDATQYSRHLQDVMALQRARTMLVFPYSPDDFISFLMHGKHEDLKKQAEELRGMIDTRNPIATPNDIGERAMQIGLVVRKAYPHFWSGDEICARQIAKGLSFRDIAQSVCRIVVISDKDRSDVWHNQALMLQIAALGVCVPTFLARPGFGTDYFADEATYVQQPVNDDVWSTQCLKYADKAHLLIVLGRCGPARDHGTVSKSFRFVSDWRRLIDEPDKGSVTPWRPHYSVFPCLRLLKQWSRDYVDYLPDNADVRTALLAKGKYFDTLRDEIERPLT